MHNHALAPMLRAYRQAMRDARAYRKERRFLSAAYARRFALDTMAVMRRMRA